MCRPFPLATSTVFSSAAMALLAGVTGSAQHTTIPLAILPFSLVQWTDSRVVLRTCVHVDLALPQDAN